MILLGIVNERCLMITLNPGRNMGQVISYFFKSEIKKLTNLKINVLHYQPAEDGFGFSYTNTVAFKDLTKADLAKIYEQIILERNEILNSLKMIDLMIEVKLCGKLDGIFIKETFNDINVFHCYLENNSIIEKPTLILKNSS